MNPEFDELRQKELPMNSIAKASLAFQYRIMKRFYLTSSFSYRKISEEFSPFNNSFKMHSYGLSLGYESLIGPISLYASKNSQFDFLRIYFSIGFKF